MMGTPRVSVIMAAYNVGSREVLDASISSVVNQDMSDWELLVCDDCSTDDTHEWLLEWSRRDSRICVLKNEENRKAAYTRNCCLAQAKGKYIAIMDADDACSPNRFSAQVNFLDSYHQYSFVGVLGKRFEKNIGDKSDLYWFCRKPEPKDFLMTLPFVHASIMFRREALLAVNGYEETARVERSEDYDMLLRMYAAGMRGANISDAVYYIREDSNALHRRKYRYRIKETLVKFRGFVRLGLMPKGIAFAIKPIIVGLIPATLLNRLKGRYYGQRMEQP